MDDVGGLASAAGGAAVAGAAVRMAGTGELGSPVALERKGGCARIEGADVGPAATIDGAAATGTAGRSAGTGELSARVALVLEENDEMPLLPPLTPNVLELLLGTVVFEMKGVRGDCGRGAGSCGVGT